jgi:hypothetical protein
MKPTTIFSVSALILSAPVASASTIFSSDLDDGVGWGIVENGDTSSQFGFDYSALGIPSAPNGTGTTGLRLAANISADAPGGGSGIAAHPGISVSGQYTVQFDFWLNYHINGSTEDGGGSVGFNPGNGVPLGGTSLIVNTDGDSGSDYRLFNGGTSLSLASGMYSITSLNNSDPSNLALQTAFPSQTAPAEQGTGYTNQAGSFAFAWHTMLIDVDSAAQTASFSIDGFHFGTVTGGDYTGDVALIYQDPFGSVSGNADLGFGVFDNLVVEQIPEPSTAILITLSAGLIGLRRRK